jgi:V/A-type H+-transporting ATPase subunit E
MTEQPTTASGVKELIDRLRDEGVQAGKDEANRLVKTAEEKAVAKVAKARKEAQQITDKAKAEIEAERAAAKESLKVAIRDTSLELEADLKAAFAAHVKRLVSMELQDREFLREMILLIAGQATKDKIEGKDVAIKIPQDWFEIDEKRAKHFVLGISGDMLREGVELYPGEERVKGIKVQLKGQDMEIDLSEDAISRFLLKYLLPRFRSIIEGMG